MYLSKELFSKEFWSRSVKGQGTPQSLPRKQEDQQDVRYVLPNKRGKQNTRALSTGEICVWSTLVPGAWGVITQVKIIFVVQFYLYFHCSCLRNLFCPLFFRFSEQTNGWRRKCWCLFEYIVGILLIFHFPARWTLYNREFPTKEEEKRGDKYRLTNRTGKLGTGAISVSENLSLEYADVFCEDCFRCKNWSKDYFCGRVLFVFPL